MSAIVVEDNTLSYDTNVKEPCCLEHSAFKKVYSKICNVMTDIDNLSQYFVEEGIINDSEMQHILQNSKTAAQKVQRILMHISNPLESGSTKHFYLTLDIMEQHGSTATKELAQDLRKELRYVGTIKGKHNLPCNYSNNNKRMKLNYTATEDYHFDEIPDETFLMNYVPMISHKWITIAIKLGFTTEQITEILNAKELSTSSSKDSEYSCCSKLLLEWVKMRMVDCSYHKLLLTLSSPQVDLSEVADLLYSDLQDKFNPSKVKNLRISPPDPIQTKYLFMIKDVVEELNKSGASMEQLKQLLEYDFRAIAQERIDPAVYKDAANWSEFIKSFQKHKYITNSDLSWLTFIVNDYAKCKSAAERIEKYTQGVKNMLVLNQLPWLKPSHSDEAFLHVKTAKEPYNATMECLHKATNAGFALTDGQTNETDAKLHSISVGCVAYYWKIPFQTGLNLELPQSITAEQKKLCDDASVTHIGIIAGNRSDQVEIAQLQVIDTEDDVSRRLDQPCKYHHGFELSQNIKKWEPLASQLGFSEEEIKAIKYKYSSYSVQKIKVLCKWITRHKFAATPRVLQEHFSGCNEICLSVHSVTHLNQSFTTAIMEQYTAYLKKQMLFEVVGSVNSGFAKTEIELKDVFHIKEGKPKCIYIFGPTGIGKSMLAYKICADWANGSFLKEYNAMILMLLRSWVAHYANPLDQYSAVENIGCWLLTKDENFQQQIVREILKNSKSKICFILDGYDELPPKLQDRPLFSGILNSFTNSVIVYLSRQSANKQIKRHHATFRHIEIGGFSENAMKVYIRSALNMRGFSTAIKVDEQVEKLLEIIKRDPVIHILRYIPFYLALGLQAINFDDKPGSLTQLYQSFVQTKIDFDDSKRFKTKVERDLEISKISEMAFNGIKGYCFLFSKPYVQTVTDNVKLFRADFSTDGYMFSHLSVQEFLAGLYVSKLPEEEQLKVFIQHRHYPCFEMVWTFYAGLTKLNFLEMFHLICPTKNVFSFVSKKNWMQSIACLNETQNYHLYDKITKEMSGCMNLSGCEMDFLKCCTLAHFIKSCSAGSIKTLILDGCKINDDRFLKICKSLKAYFTRCSCSEAEMTDTHFMDLSVSDNELSETSALSLVHLLEDSACISKLTLDGNHLGDQGIAILLNSILFIKNLKELNIKRCGLKTKGMQALRNFLNGHNSDIQMIDLSDNNIDLNVLNSLSEAVNKKFELKLLSIMHCRVKIDGSLLAMGKIQMKTIKDKDDPNDKIKHVDILNSLAIHDLDPVSKMDNLTIDVCSCIKTLSKKRYITCQSFSNVFCKKCTLEDLEVSVHKSDDFEMLVEKIKKNTSIRNLKLLFTSYSTNWLVLIQNLVSHKTNLEMLSIDGLFTTEDHMLQQLAMTLLKSKRLVTFKCTPQEGIVSCSALNFLASVEPLDSLECITLTLEGREETTNDVSISCTTSINDLNQRDAIYQTFPPPFPAQQILGYEPEKRSTIKSESSQESLQNLSEPFITEISRSTSSYVQTKLKEKSKSELCKKNENDQEKYSIIQKMEKLVTAINEERNSIGKEHLQLFLEFPL